MIELATLVPVLNRPRNVEPLVYSFLTSRTPGTLVFIVNVTDIDEMQAIERASHNKRVDVIQTIDAVTWPAKINLGTSLIDAEWYLCAADDITFGDDWWGATRHLRADKTIGVIGTHDSKDGTGNQAVAGHTHTCHPLIRGSYIRTQGTWDGPGQAVSEDYHHWYVDNELVVTAKLRDAWAFCPEAVLEHNHPYWNGDIDWDDTYTLGESRADEDLATWQRRYLEQGSP